MITTDASVFEIEPTAFSYPKNKADLIERVRKALDQQMAITPRAGGTSLGGQAIGSGLLLDVSKHLTQILEVRPEQKEVVVEPGVIQDDLNQALAQYNLKFAPDTSTSNRAMIGGMIGNNSCGAYSVYYGTTRDHVKSVDMVLSDGQEVTFGPLSPQALDQKCALETLEGHIYRSVLALLKQHGEAILDAFPDPSIIRRTTGYALDVLYSAHQPFNPQGQPFNLAPLICGSEGTLGFITQATLHLVERPRFNQVFCAHFDDMDLAMKAVPEFLAFDPAAIELIDRPTLDGTKNNRDQTQNRFWVQGDPEGVLVVELYDQSADNLALRLASAAEWMQTHGAYACPIIDPQDTAKVWAVRKAGLGLLMGKPTRKKAVAVIEDAAVPVKSLPDFYRETQAIMQDLGIGCVYYGHASVGLIHVRPEIDLATAKGREQFQTVAQRSSELVKKYRGAISGEHGDGRIRAPFIKAQLGETVYQCLVDLKATFDPEGRFNPGVILGTQPITEQLRADRQPQVTLQTGYDWHDDLSLMDAVEKCNGAGACRKSPGNGVMCPSYQATREENFSTRGRANLLRRALTEPQPQAALKKPELQEALALCLGCKACQSECPASVDMARLKSEMLYQAPQQSLSRWSIKHYGRLMRMGALWPSAYNWVQSQSWVKKAMGVDTRRPLPALQPQNFKQWLRLKKQSDTRPLGANQGPHVWLLVDLYTQYQEPAIAQAAYEFLDQSGYRVHPILLESSPRALLSQGLLDEAKAALQSIFDALSGVRPEDYIVGLEPSDTLVWRDEAKDLIFPDHQAWSFQSVLLFEELVLKLHQHTPFPFKPMDRKIWLHVHCHQKSIAQAKDVESALSLIPKVALTVIPSGCCGMSGEFGYKNYDVSKTIAQQSILPSLDQADDHDWIIATGTSCRHQMQDFAQKQAMHSAQVFLQALGT